MQPAAQDRTANWRTETAKACLILLVLAAITRGWIFGNPVITDDEQFYLLAGDRLLHGQLPYLDVWDRKPIGLFLIYALACRIFADPVIGYQLLAAVFALLTALLLFAMARRLASFAASVAGAAAYLVWMPVFGGIAGQTPVFYNLPMAAAAALILAAVARSDGKLLTLKGCAIMLLTGLAIQLKYVAALEGMFFGLTLMWTRWKCSRSPLRLACDMTIWIACALGPTLAAYAFYAGKGHGAEFIQANFLSVLADTKSIGHELANLAGLTAGISPFLACAWLTHRQWRIAEGMRRAEIGWILAWAGVGLLAVMAFGAWADHYFLPVLMPFCLTASLAFDAVRWRKTAMTIIVGLGLTGGMARAVIETRMSGNAVELAQLAVLVRPHLAKGCLHVDGNLPALYRVTQSCLPTRYIFPPHLTDGKYANSLGVDQTGELRRILHNRPAVIVTDGGLDNARNARDLLDATLRQGYAKVGEAKVGSVTFAVYAAD